MYSLTAKRTNLALWVKVLGVLLFATATAVSARIAVPVPFSPVPLTLQVLVVVMSGLVLGCWGGLAAQALYLQAILLGAPITATGLAGPAAFLMPTAGYLLAFPLAAALAGWLSELGKQRLLGRVAGGLGALAVIYALGMAWLSRFVGGAGLALKLGVLPFMGADLLKVTIATGLLSLRRK
jgi:biotin transport system substrate-specific component